MSYCIRWNVKSVGNRYIYWIPTKNEINEMDYYWSVLRLKENSAANCMQRYIGVRCTVYPFAWRNCIFALVTRGNWKSFIYGECRTILRFGYTENIDPDKWVSSLGRFFASLHCCCCCFCHRRRCCCCLFSIVFNEVTSPPPPPGILNHAIVVLSKQSLAYPLHPT